MPGSLSSRGFGRWKAGTDIVFAVFLWSVFGAACGGKSESVPVFRFTLSAPSSKIAVDQAGYLPEMPKFAMVVDAAHAPAREFELRSQASNSVVFRGTLTPPELDEDSGDQIRIADFSSYHESGRYFLEVEGIGRSWGFSIDSQAFLRPYYLAMRSYYGQRCGTAVDLGSEFPGYRHGPCHLVGAFHSSSGKTGSHVSTHGWHDAGDYGRYMVNSGISTGTLLWAWELFGDRIGHVGLHLPESGNGTPDILNEIRWNLEWMLTLQDGDGGVWHKQTSAKFSGFIMPEKDDLVSEVIGTGQKPYKSSCATGDFAAVMSIAGRAYKPFDEAAAVKFRAAAENAWTWLEANPDVTFANPPGISTGGYDDSDCGDEHLWGAAELFRTTGRGIYRDYFDQHYREYLDGIRPVGPPSWAMVGPLGLWSYALGKGGSEQARREIQQRSIQAADQIAERTSHDGYRISLASRDYVWGSNAVAANYSMQLLIADRFQHKQQYVDAAVENIHYLLGRNTFSLSWVSQVGEHAFQHPHHRPSAADGMDAPWPGLLSGGPNPGRQDSAMKKMLSPDLPPAKMYVDETGAYACNEVAINWNAPLVFALAALVSGTSARSSGR